MLQQSINTTITQQLQLTPKLQQAIHLLQLSTQELTQELQQIMLANILLEMDDGQEIKLEAQQINIVDAGGVCSQISVDETTLYEEINTSTTYSENDTPSSCIDNYHQTTISLQEHLRWQLNLTPLSFEAYKLGEILIDSINDEGYLTATQEDIRQALMLMDQIFDATQVEKILRLVQSFGPNGVGARNLQECLMLQLNTLDAKTNMLDIAKVLVTSQLELLGAHKYNKLCRELKITANHLSEAIELIKKCNPRPGSSFSHVDANYIVPDVIVEKKGKGWQVALNTLVTPRLRFNNNYLQMMNASPNANTASQQFIHQQLNEARWLSKSLHKRNETLLRVATSIVKHQYDFLEHGAVAMKPLVLQTIAEDLELHQSTVSRITTRKYIQTPRGTFELKYFFSAHLETNHGVQCSSLATQNYIQEIIKNENNKKPFSDNIISQKLLEFGIHVSRRTVAKYREAMAIPPAHIRKTILN